MTDLTKAELSRNGKTIRIWENPAPGETFTYTDDQIFSAGTYTYSVICAGASGQGIETSASAFIGYPQPASPENVEMDIEPITGKITLTWDEVTTDFEGNPINPEAVKYFVLKGKGGSGYDDDVLAGWAFPGSAGNTAFSSSTLPSMDTWKGTDLGLPLADITVRQPGLYIVCADESVGKVVFH